MKRRKSFNKRRLSKRAYNKRRQKIYASIKKPPFPRALNNGHSPSKAQSDRRNILRHTTKRSFNPDFPRKESFGKRRISIGFPKQSRKNSLRRNQIFNNIKDQKMIKDIATMMREAQIRNNFDVDEFINLGYPPQILYAALQKSRDLKESDLIKIWNSKYKTLNGDIDSGIYFDRYKGANITNESYNNLKRKILVLDLDETLVHTRCGNPQGRYKTDQIENPPDLVFNIKNDLTRTEFGVYKRPNVDLFLNIVSKWYDLVIYTASTQEYATEIIDYLDNGRKILNKRLYRQHCTFDRNLETFTKDLKLIDDDLSNIVILDNTPDAYKNLPENGIPIQSWYEDKSDNCLIDLIPLFYNMRFCDDVREFIKKKKLRTSIGIINRV